MRLTTPSVLFQRSSPQEGGWAPDPVRTLEKGQILSGTAIEPGNSGCPYGNLVTIMQVTKFVLECPNTCPVGYTRRLVTFRPVAIDNTQQVSQGAAAVPFCSDMESKANAVLLSRLKVLNLFHRVFRQTKQFCNLFSDFVTCRVHRLERKCILPQNGILQLVRFPN